MRSPCFPVSVKGVVLTASGVVLLRNERDEWELPGGKLEPGESPAACLVREIEEELGMQVTPGPLLDAWVYHVTDETDVLVVTYGCYGPARTSIVASAEHRAARCFGPDEVPGLRMPDGYKTSIRRWVEQLGSSASAPTERGADDACRPDPEERP
jgi:8-oxo-dGTP pyrophosphatase MutT (NUDIX family)